MEPYDVFSSGGVQLERDTLGGDLDVSTFPALNPAALKSLLAGQVVKQLDLVRLQGEPYYVARTGRERVLVDAHSMKIRHHPFSTESLLNRIKEGAPDVPILAAELLSDYDYYYYSRDGAAPLPVLRVKFDDPEQTWLYVDPAMSRVLTGATRTNRIQRWIYTGLHDLDFPFWYYRRPLWDIGVIVLSLGGIASSVIGLCIGFKRLSRGSKRVIFR
jgi:hypothetical protein